jgi:O-antigen ligase
MTLLAALFASQSRSGWVAAVVAIIVVLAVLSRLARLLFSLIMLLSTLFGLAGALTLNFITITNASDSQNLYQTMLQRLVDATDIFRIENLAQIELTDANFATLERLAHWQAAWGMWRDNFWVGVGFGNYELVYPVYAIGSWHEPLGHAHNYLFNLGAETGFIGLLCYIIFWFLTFGLIGQTIRRTTGFAQAVAVGCLGIMVHLHVHNLFDNLYVQGMYLHIAILLAFISILWRQEVGAKSI